MAYLIDTDIVLDHLAAHPAAVALLDELADSGLFISIITYHHHLHGSLSKRAA